MCGANVIGDKKEMMMMIIQKKINGIEMMMIIQKKINGDKKDHTKNLLQRYFLFISV
jgi:hypothetical protein